MARQISGRRVACPPARRPRRELRSARRLEARPGPAGPAAASNRAGLGARVLPLAPPPPNGTAPWPCRPRCQSHFIPSHRTLIAESTINFACNSLTALSNHEFRLLVFQRFHTLLKLLPIELHAKLGDGGLVGLRWGLGRDLFRPAWPVVGLSVTKFAQHAKNGPKLAVCGVLGEFCTGLTQERPVQGEFCTGLARKVASGDSYGPVGTRKDAYLAVVVPGATRTEAGRTTVVPPQPPTSRAPAPRERGKPPTASCQKRIRTPRQLPTRSE